MTRNDYKRASEIVRSYFSVAGANHTLQQTAETARELFVAFFRADNPRFDVSRFRAACERAERGQP
jgi:hypothetical protein